MSANANLLLQGEASGLQARPRRPCQSPRLLPFRPSLQGEANWCESDAQRTKFLHLCYHKASQKKNADSPNLKKKSERLLVALYSTKATPHKAL